MQDIGPERPVVVIGAGIVGLCVAAWLCREGVPVTVIDRRGPGEMTSYGNQGGIQSMAATPVGIPGMMKHLPNWLMDPTGPLAIRPGHLPKAAGWFWKFWRQTALDKVWHNATALNDLNRFAAETHLALAEWSGARDLFRIPGQLYVWRNKANFDHATLSREIWEATGQPFDVLTGDEIRQIEPQAGKLFEVGLRIPGNGHCRNPYEYALALARAVTESGGRILREDVTGFLREGGRVVGVMTDRGPKDAGAVVLAAGVWSRRLAATLGYRVPLESQRGYHVTIADPRVEVRNMLLVADKSIAVTPMQMGLRIGGTVEFAGTEALPDYRRSKALLTLGKELFPDLETEKVTEWMGHRPCTPDSVPVIGRAERHRNVMFAFGHGHMGLLGAAPTGRIIADLVIGKTPKTDLRPFRIERFGDSR